MNPDTTEESSKVHGDKLEHTAGEPETTKTPHQSALDQLEIPPHDRPRTDGGTKLHGDKLEPHGGKA